MSISIISITGSKFYRSDGQQFFIKGVVYAPGISNVDSSKSDVLSIPLQCAADIAQMKILGVNTIRVYTVNSTFNHDDCMTSFANAGIYVLVHLENPFTGINRATPAWTLPTYDQYATVMDVFSKYTNLLGFFVGNEIVNDYQSLAAAPYLKAAIADMKRYRNSKGYRKVPIGSSLADFASIRKSLQEYLVCEDSASGSDFSVDFIGLHNYGWCGDSSFAASGYDTVLQETQGYNIPVFFSETGCNARTRTFSDQAAILGSQMNSRFSGAIIYEWSEEASKYGLIEYEESGDVATPAPKPTDFDNLRKQWSTLTPKGTDRSLYTPSTIIPSCPTSTRGSSAWTINPTQALPTLALQLVNTPSTESGTSTSTRLQLPTLSRVAGSTSSSTTIDTTIAPQNNGGHSSGSNGKTIGIGVGVGVAALALLAVLVWFLIQRRNKQKSRQTITSSNGNAFDASDGGICSEKPELEGSSVLVKPGSSRYNVAVKPELEAYSAAVLAGKEKQVLATEERRQEIHQDFTTGISELGDGEVAAGNLESKSFIGGDPALVREKTSASNINSSNTPWYDEGREDFNSTNHATWALDASPTSSAHRSAAVSALAQAQADRSSAATDNDEIARLEEEEKRLDREIVESERLRNLQKERERVRRLLEEKRKAGGNS